MAVGLEQVRSSVKAGCGQCRESVLVVVVVNERRVAHTGSTPRRVAHVHSISEDAVVFQLRLNLGGISISSPKIDDFCQLLKFNCTVRRTALAAHAQRDLALFSFSCGESPRRGRTRPRPSWKAPASKHGDLEDGRPDVLLASLPRAERLLAPVCSAAGSVLCVWREGTSVVASFGRRCCAPVAHRKSYAVVDLPPSPSTN